MNEVSTHDDKQELELAARADEAADRDDEEDGPQHDEARPQPAHQLRHVELTHVDAIEPGRLELILQCLERRVQERVYLG